MIRDTRDFTVHVEGECREALQASVDATEWRKERKEETNSILDRKKFSPKLIFNEGWWDKRKEKIESNKLLLFRFIS